MARLDSVNSRPTPGRLPKVIGTVVLLVVIPLGIGTFVALAWRSRIHVVPRQRPPAATIEATGIGLEITTRTSLGIPRATQPPGKPNLPCTSTLSA